MILFWRYKKKEGIGTENIEEAAQNQKHGYVNGGYTYYNFSIGKVVILFYPATSPKQLVNIYSHEKRHLEDRVLQYVNVGDNEASAYLAGFLGEKLFEFNEQREKK